MSDGGNVLPILDRIAAVDAMGGDEEMFDTFLDLFIEETANQMVEIEAAIALDDAKRLERAAHSLKGAAGTMHAERVSQLAQQLETMGKSGDIEDCPSVFSRLQAEVEILREYVQTL